jgi:hypothetical protein
MNMYKKYIRRSELDENEVTQDAKMPPVCQINYKK